MIVFIDTEVNPHTKRVEDYGAVREDGAVLHSRSKADFDVFVSKCDTVCGHNIINHDLKYTPLRGNPAVVDTLLLSPLLFPKRPYHHLVKDDKLQVDELNNPVNDSMKARDLLNDEVAAWNQLSPARQEIYYQLLHGTDSKEKWHEAKRRTLETYASSTCLSVMKHFFADFEVTHKFYYRSDLHEYIFESNIEDFIASDEKSVFVSTIHKAKGREFDNVYLLSPVPDGRIVEDMRAYYVGLTRAKRNLYLVTNPPVEYSSISIALDMHDVWLDFFKGRKDLVLRLRSGDGLQYKDGYLLNEQDLNIVALSSSGKDKLKAWTDKGYEVVGAKVSYTLAWRPKDSETEYAVCLANLVLKRNLDCPLANNYIPPIT